MRKLQLIWVDLSVSVKEAELPSGFDGHCDIQCCADIELLDETLSRFPADVVCFDFDYPDRAGLRLLRESKLNHPSLPILMLTVQHSESLAIWAFRTKVWDYLVKPVPVHEVNRCISALIRISGQRHSQPGRTPATHGYRIPHEVSFVAKPDDSALTPAIYYVERYFRAKIRSEDVANRCGMSPFRFSRAFKQTYAMTFRDYVVGYRLKEACRLLENPATSVTDVAYAVGFNDASYFARVFKQRLGLPPSAVVGRSFVDYHDDEHGLPEMPQVLP